MTEKGVPWLSPSRRRPNSLGSHVAAVWIMTLLTSIVSVEAVGKSSLIATFVSRQFPTTVPGVMTRVQLPPDPRSSSITTIVDSQSGDRAIMEGTMEHVDAIVLVYDLSREETFCRLEEHWLPLVERFYGGKVCGTNEHSFADELFRSLS